MTLPAAVLLAFTSSSAAASAPAWLGCFELDRGASLSVYDPESPIGSGTAFFGKEIVRCLDRDGGVIERRIVTFSSPAGGRARESTHSGTWSGRGELLAIGWEDGSRGEWAVEPFDGGLDVGGELWLRLDLDPAALGAEAGGDGPAAEDEAAPASGLPDEPADAEDDEEDEEGCEDGGCDEGAGEADAEDEEDEEL
jgi:hypothetical protein